MPKFLLLAALAAVPAVAQVRVSLPTVPVTPAAPVVLAAPSISPVALTPLLQAPSLTPSLAPALLPSGWAEGRRVFDGAASTPDRPVPLNPARPSRGGSVSLNGVELPARVFSDEGKISSHLIKAIDASRTSIDIAIHGLALREVAEALSRAKKRGVKIRVVMNQTHVFPEKARDVRSPEVQRLMDEGFEMRMLRGGDQFGVQHNKIAIFDGQILETGSYNWTHAADAWHFENVMFHAEAARVSAYQAYWGFLWEKSVKIPKKAPAIPEPLPEGAPRPGLPPAPQDPGRPIQFRGQDFPGQAFSPAGVSAHLIKALDLATQSIELAMFSFTSEELRDALVRARERGVRVSIVFDADQFKYLSEMRWFDEQGFDVTLSRGKDGKKGVMHHKFVVIDRMLAVAGSFNWTRNAEKNNYENAMFLDTPDDVTAYAQAFARAQEQGWAPEDADHAPHSDPAAFSHPDGL